MWGLLGRFGAWLFAGGWVRALSILSIIWNLISSIPSLIIEWLVSTGMSLLDTVLTRFDIPTFSMMWAELPPEFTAYWSVIGLPEAFRIIGMGAGARIALRLLRLK